jgi:hypothetical protein
MNADEAPGFSQRLKRLWLSGMPLLEMIVISEDTMPEGPQANPYRQCDHITIRLTEADARTLSKGGMISVAAVRIIEHKPVEIPCFLKLPHGERTPRADRSGGNWRYW